LWAIATPLLVVAARFGLLDLGPGDRALEAAAVQLESAATLCSPDRESFTNPAKALAAELAGTLPMVWGTGQVGPVAALRMVCQIAENAKLPAIAGALPEAHHNQVVAFDGPLAGGNSDDDLFRDRVDDEEALRLRLLLLRDDDHDEVAKQRAHASADVAAARGIKVSVLGAQGESAIERIASIVGIADFASVYLGLAYGTDPTPISPIDDLKRALQDPRTL
jgi:glucose/mannose-6-phosphate isomerase